MKDEAALVAALTSDTRYDAAVTGGSNSDLLALLNADEPRSSAPVTEVPRRQVIRALGGGVDSLPDAEANRLRVLLTDDTVDPRRAAAVVSDPTAKIRLTALSTRTRTYVEAFGYERISLQELWSALRQVPKSHLATYLRTP